MNINLKHRYKSWRYNRRYPFPIVPIENLLKGRKPFILDLSDWDSDLRAGGFIDSLTIISVARFLEPSSYWEIGTGDGRTSLLVAQNTPDSTAIFTLDPEYPGNDVKGKVFRGRPEAAKIQQFGGYSESFDFSPWYATAGLVFVDGGHEFEQVLNDCEVAFKLVAPGGWILWHDAAMDVPGVARALKQCSRAGRIETIAGTRYALYRDPSVK